MNSKNLGQDNNNANMNDENEILLRKYADSIRIAGIGIIAIGIWSVIRLLLLTMFRTGEFVGVIEKSLNESMRGLFWYMLILALLIDLAFRGYIAKCALSEAKGNKKGYLYLVFAGLLAIVSICSIIYYLFTVPNSYVELAANLLMESTALVIALELIHSSIKIKKLSLLLKGRG